MKSKLFAKTGFYLLFSLAIQQAHSANIAVTTTPLGSGCTLSNAILSANADAGFGGCTAGNGDDIISIPSSLGAHIYTAPLSGSNNALPLITSNVYIRGVGGQVELRRSGTNRTRFFSVDDSSVLTIENMRLNNGASVNDLSDAGGGAIAVDRRATLFVLDSVLENNVASETTDGGAIKVDVDATAVIFNSTLRANTASSGGAIESRSATVRLVDSRVIDNQGSRDGGMLVIDGSLYMENSIVDGNMSTSETGGGTGGISISGAQVEIIDSRIVHNHGKRDGGGLSISDSNVLIRRSLIANNIVDVGAGGGILANRVQNSVGEVRIDIYDTTISENRANQGAGMFIALRENKYVNFYNSTIAFNQSLNGGDDDSEGIYIAATPDMETNKSTVSFINTIVSGNGTDSFEPREIFASLQPNYEVRFINSLIGHSGITYSEAISSSSSNGAVPITPPQASNIRAYSDGFDATPLNKIISRQRSEFVHPLVSGSPAIDNATEGFFGSQIFTFWTPGCRGEEIEIRSTRPPFRIDQRQSMRPVNNSCDIGAAEYFDDSLCVVMKASNDNVINFCL